MDDAYLKYDEYAMDPYTPPVLYGGRLHAHPSHLYAMKEYPCICCIHCWRSICAEPCENPDTCRGCDR